MIVIDAETGKNGIDKNGVQSAKKLKERNLNARLFTMRIDYDVAVTFGSDEMERTAQ